MGEAYPIKNQEVLFYLTFQVAGWAEGHITSITTEIYANIRMKRLKNIKTLSMK